MSVGVIEEGEDEAEEDGEDARRLPEKEGMMPRHNNRGGWGRCPLLMA